MKLLQLLGLTVRPIGGAVLYSEVAPLKFGI